MDSSNTICILGHAPNRNGLGGPLQLPWAAYQTIVHVLDPLGPVAPILLNFNHQLAYFADQSDTTHVPHQPTAVA